ncbi:MAG: Holliday junction resolvase RuvX [Pseudomonadota bacterium]|nr:Holliday junction resolvase RuvX [Pseudomonadota bacterium]MDE3037040.1 Holliday junction resolvase RuvX [Pseudomonadota bacterium]
MAIVNNDKLIIANSPAEFTAALPSAARLLGLDVGEKTIGLALTDATRRIATPLSTIERGKFTKDMEHLKKIIAAHAVAGLVIGYPINMDGSLGPRAQSTRTFVSNLQKYIELPMLLWDERLSTMAVERAMLEADLSRARRDALVDKLAAGYMLQGFLDSVR